MTTCTGIESWPADLRVCACGACGKWLCGATDADRVLAALVPWRDRPSADWLRDGSGRPVCGVCRRRRGAPRKAVG